VHDSESHDYEPLINRRSRTARDLPAEEEFHNRKRIARKDLERDSQPRLAVEPINLNSSQEGNRNAYATGSINSPLLKRGHTISFFGLMLFTAFVYFRPYEFAPGLTFLSSGAKWIAIFTLAVFIPTQLGLEGNIVGKIREVKLILLLALTALLSLPMAISISEGWDYFTEFLKVVAMFIVMVNVVRTEGRLRWMFWLVLAVSFTTSFAAINDYRSGTLLLGGERIKGVIGGLFENPNDLALHLVTISPLTVGLFLYRPGGFKKILYGSAVAVMVLAVICTFSRAGFLGLMAAAIVLALKFGRKNRPAVIVISLVLVVAFTIFAPAEYGGRLASIFGGDVTGSVGARQDLFWRSVRVALRYPLFGVGIGNFHFKSIHEQVSHNSYTQVASELGMTALVIYVLLMLTPLKNLRRIENETRGHKEQARFYYLAVGLQASIIGYMVSSFFASVAFLWYLYYLVGYAVCLGRLYGPVSEVAPKESSSVDLKPALLEPSRQKVGAI
jgi:O-antigen ligase